MEPRIVARSHGERGSNATAKPGRGIRLNTCDLRANRTADGHPDGRSTRRRWQVDSNLEAAAFTARADASSPAAAATLRVDCARRRVGLNLEPAASTARA